MARKIWTEEEIAKLRELYPDHYAMDIARQLGVNIHQVYRAASRLGLKKSQAFQEMELRKQGERLKRAGAKHRYEKGREPENKGKKMSAELYEKCKPTMFKKGQLPHNTQYDGHERIDTKDGYTHIRTALGRYELKHRVVWEAANGPIPDGMILVFKDGDKRNITVENLELITRGENMRRNSITRYPTELKQTFHLLGKLKRKINEKQNPRP